MNIATVSAARPWILGAAGKQRIGKLRLIRIERWDVRRDGALSQAALEQKVRALGYEPTLRTYPAGRAICGGRSPTPVKRVEAVVSGLVKVTLDDGDTAILTAGDIVFVPRGGARRLEVVGTSPAYCLERSPPSTTPDRPEPAGSALLRFLHLAARVGRVRRLRELIDDPRESVRRVVLLPRLHVGAAELHQHAVGRQL
jgi:hypothetical protein